MIRRGTSILRILIPVLIGSIFPVYAIAQNATGNESKPPSIGQEMEALTAKFNNPDPIVEMDAYNNAFANPNPIIRQMALSSAANSTNPEIRAIAMMGAMAHVKSLVLSFTPNKSDSSAKNLYNATGGMLTIQIEKFDSNNGSFLYVVDDANKEGNIQNKHFSVGTITGETIQLNMTAIMANSQESCPAILSLKNGKLSGTMTCTGVYTMIRAPVTATIF
jgi:hypothetical protein